MGLLTVIEYYPIVKQVHIASVIASGALFAMRGAAGLAGQHWPMSAPLRYLSYSIDSVLLTAALMLMTMLHVYPIAHDWLTVKLALLVLYIVLGSLAMKRAREWRQRFVSYSVALVVYLLMAGIARAHHPLGWLRWWGWA